MALLYAHCIDFEKAFDSLHGSSLWNIMKAYGMPGSVPEKVIYIVRVRSMHEGFECAVMDEGDLTG